MGCHRWIQFVCLPALIAGVASCNIVGPAAYLIGGLPKVEAEHPLANRTTVVFVDDRSNTIPLNSRSIRRTIADRVSQDLMGNDVLTPEQTIRPQDALSFAAARDRHSELLAIDEIGRGVGAQQVIYVQMVAFADSPDGATPRPTAVCQVRVIDVVNRTRLYPAEDQAMDVRTMQVMMEEIDPTALRSPSSRLKVHTALAEVTGEHIAKLFYKHVPRELGERLEPR